MAAREDSHMLWIGERTNNSKEAHIAYASTIENPVGIKVGPKSSTKNILDSLKILSRLLVVSQNSGSSRKRSSMTLSLTLLLELVATHRHFLYL